MKDILAKYYGIINPKIIQLDSNDKMNIGYGSLNYKIIFNNKILLLKIYKHNKKNLNFVKSENRVIIHLNKTVGDIFPKITKNMLNEELSISKKEGKIYRVLTYIEGEFLAESKHSMKLFSNLGTLLGKIDKELVQLEDPHIESRKIDWDIKHLYSNRKYIAYIKKAEDRKIVEYFFQQFKENVVPHYYSLRESIIYNDANDWNILIKKEQIIGVIDFGDMVKSFLINEIAISLSYLLTKKNNPIQWVIPFIKTYHKIIKLKVLEIDILYYLIAVRLCTTISKSSFHKKDAPKDEYISVSKEDAMLLLKKWLTINPIFFKNEIKKALNISIKKQISDKDLIKKRNKYLSKSYSLSYQSPIQMGKAAFQYMYDTIGNTYLDAYNNVPLVGHEHPKITKAAQKQIGRLNTNTRYLYKNLTDYAKLLLKKFPKKFTKIFFVNSGSAATDLAIRIARLHTKNKKIAVIEQGYHGNTSVGIDISHYKYSRKGGYKKKKNIIELEIPNTYNNLCVKSKSGYQYAKEAIQKLKKEKKLCAFIAEPIIGCAGQVIIAKNYIKKMHPTIKKLGGLYISDETQTGFGRLGKYFWGYEMHKTVPDIVILGKPIGNGHPMAAVVTTDTINQSFENGMEFFSSFGGNPVSCEIGKEVLKIIERENLQKNALIVGKYLYKKLIELKNNYKTIDDVRGCGLFIGIECVNHKGEPGKKEAKYITNELKKKFILVSTDGQFENIIKIKPPLCFTKNNAKKLVNSIEEIIK